MEHSITNDEKLLTPWKDGHYINRKQSNMLWLIEGESITIISPSGRPTKQDDSTSKGTIKHGDFGNSPPDIAEKSGKLHYNAEFVLWSGAWKRLAVVSDDGKRIYHHGMSGNVDHLDWMDEKEVSEFILSGDRFDAIPHHYKIQPENQGKLIWISGAPGLGKSTSGMYLSRKEGYVYYEADAFMSHLNPYVPTNVDEPTLATFSQNFLTGLPQERIDLVASARSNFMDVLQGKEFDFEKMCKYYTILSEDINKEQTRIGGNFAVAHAVPTRKFRDHIRNVLGSNLIFVVLHMTKEDQISRIQARHGKEERTVQWLTKSYDMFEPAAEDEPNTISLVITKDMSRDDVVDKIVELVERYQS